MGNWFRRFTARLGASFRYFMQGRYGTDKLNTAILVAGVIACFGSMLFRFPLLNWILTMFAYACMGVALFRMLSRNTYKRYEENRKYLRFLERAKDRNHRYYACPRCRQTVRVPRGKGKIYITCPKCRERFLKKT